MSERIDTRRSFQRWRHTIHHVSVNKRHLRDIMRINANKLAPFFFVSDHVVNGHFCRSACCGGDCQNRYTGFIGRGKSFQATHIGKLRVVADNANRFTSILWRTTTNSDQVIRAAILEYTEPFFDDSNCWVGHYAVVNRPCQPCSIHLIGHFCHHAALHQRFIGDDQRLLITTAFHLIG